MHDHKKPTSITVVVGDGVFESRTEAEIGIRNAIEKRIDRVWIAV